MTKNANENFDYNGLIVLSQLSDLNAYKRYYYYIKSGKCTKIDTPLGLAISIEEYKNIIKKNQRKLDRAVVDLSEYNRFNALYVRLDDMTEHNRIAISSQSTKKIPRFQDQNGYTVINMLDYIEPQIRILSRKLNIRYTSVKRLMTQLLIDLYKEKRKHDDFT